MNVASLIKVILAHFVALYYWLEGIFRFFVPRARKDVRGDVVLITGAGSGIGQLLSIEFAKLGSLVIGWDINKNGLEETKKKLAEKGISSQWQSFVCDISDREQVYNTAKKVESKVGDVTILINNAGIVTGKKFRECSDALMQKTMEVNAMAHFWTIKAFLPGMLQRNNGHIVTIASSAGLFGVPGLVDYCASKFAAVGLAEALHTELAYIKKTEIKSTLVCPYYIDTGMFDGVKSPVLPLLTPKYATEQIVDAVLRDKLHLFMPRLIYIFYGLRGLMPHKCYITLGTALGIFDGMNTYVGRKQD